MLQLITGAGTTGEALALSAVNKIAFTGSSPTARKVMAACAQNLTPMIAECGGKDAMLVAADADLDAAADAAAWGAVSNAGQTCIGVERVYVVDEVYQTFVEKLSERMAAARAGDDREATYGPMTMRRASSTWWRTTSRTPWPGAGERSSAACRASGGPTWTRCCWPTCRSRAWRCRTRRSGPPSR